jgi:hypothetical protein
VISALGLTPEQIERFRTIGLRLDKAGTFWHEGEKVEHARLRQALLRWLDIRDDGRDIIRLDATRYAYVEVEDAHLRARSARWDGEHCLILWDDDLERELEYATLSQADDHALYAKIRSLRGRIAGPAYHAVAERIIADGDGFALESVRARWPIANAR